MKHKNPIWNHFDIMEVDGKRTAKCKDCSSVVSAKCDRLVNHRTKCTGNKKSNDQNDLNDEASEIENQPTTPFKNQPSCSTPSRKRTADVFSQGIEKNGKAYIITVCINLLTILK